MPFLLGALLNNIFNDRIPPIIVGILIFLIDVGLILFIVNIVKYSSEKTGKSMTRTIISIVIKILIFFITVVGCQKSLAELGKMGFIIPLIK